jgi:hypothetical protein
MGSEFDAFFAHLAQRVQAEDLKAAGVGEHGVRPGDEAVQAAHAANQLMTGAQIEVVSVAEDDLRVQLFEQVLGNGFDGARGADRHEGRGLDESMRQGQGRPPRLPTGGFYLKSERHWVDSSNVRQR